MPICIPASVLLSTLEPRCRWFYWRRIVCEWGLTRNPPCIRRRRIDDTDSDTPQAVDKICCQLSKYAVQFIRVMWTKYLLSRVDVTVRSLLSYLTIVWYLSVSCFQTLISMLLLCCYCTYRKTLFYEDRWISSIQTRPVVEMPPSVVEEARLASPNTYH